MKYSIQCVVVSPLNPRVVVLMDWESVPAGEHRLYVRRLGEVDAFAYYPALETNLSSSVFQVDELLFNKGSGKYEAVLMIAGVEYATLHLHYKTPNRLLGAENANV